MTNSHIDVPRVVAVVEHGVEDEAARALSDHGVEVAVGTGVAAVVAAVTFACESALFLQEVTVESILL